MGLDKRSGAGWRDDSADLFQEMYVGLKVMRGRPGSLDSVPKDSKKRCNGGRVERGMARDGERTGCEAGGRTWLGRMDLGDRKRPIISLKPFLFLFCFGLVLPNLFLAAVKG